MEERNGWEGGNRETWAFLKEKDRNGTSKRRGNASLKEKRERKLIIGSKNQRRKGDQIYRKRRVTERRFWEEKGSCWISIIVKG